MLPLRVVCLGAGQDVGRSCILLSIGGKNVLLDCLDETEMQVLTNKGFMFLSQVEKHYDANSLLQKADSDLRICSYDSAADSYRYDKCLRLTVNAARKQELIQFASDNVSLLVTPGHKMWARVMSDVSFGKVDARELCRAEEFRLSSLARHGMTSCEEQAGYHDVLGIVSGSPRDVAFLELYGYAVGGVTNHGALFASNAGVGLWLEQRFAILGLQLGKCVTVSSATSDSKENTTGAKQYCIVNSKWSTYWQSLCRRIESRDGRRLCSWVFGKGKNAVRAIISGMFRAQQSTDTVLLAKFVAFRDQLVQAGLHAGYAVDFEAHGKWWAVSLKKDGTTGLYGSRNVQCVEYSGRTWCVTVPTGLIVVRRAKAGPDGQTVVAASRPVIVGNCGMHMGFEDARRFPDFSHLGTGDLTNVIDAVLISHFHLDHCGSLPVLTELVGYRGPVYMTHPTRAICPVLLEDFRKIAVERRGESNFFTSQNIRDCLAKVIPLSLQQKVVVDGTLEITAYYAGHVLGAAMFEIRVGSQSVVYTGDYNMTPDRHLGAAWIGKVRPDLLITESTYATYVRDSKRVREKEFLARLHSTVERGGKVLIPVFALGRVQELCILVETYWQRMNLTVPVYFTAGMAARANEYYRLFVNWTNQKIKAVDFARVSNPVIKDSFVERNMFDFQHIKPFDPSFANNPGPMVLFATPGMLHAGTSLEVFKKWAGSPLNMVLIPGYCSAGTVGATLLAGKHKQQRIEVDKKTFLEVKCSVEYLSFSAHADAAGIEELIRMCEPKNVMLVHGEKQRIAEFKRKVVRDFGVPCFDPPNGTTVTIQTPLVVPALFGTVLAKEKRVRAADYYAHAKQEGSGEGGADESLKKLRPAPPVAVDARLEVAESGKAIVFVACGDAPAVADHDVVHEVTLNVGKAGKNLLSRLQQMLSEQLDCQVALVGTRELHARSLSVVMGQDGNVCVTWSICDDLMARKALQFI